MTRARKADWSRQPVNNSLARSEFNIRRPLLRDVDLGSLPPELQDFAADLVATIIDATVLQQPGAIERLQKIASVFGQKSKDPAYAERWLVIQNIEQFKAHYPAVPEEPNPALPQVFVGDAVRSPSQRRAQMLRHMLAAADDRFYDLDLAFVERQLLMVRGDHELAARLSLECGAFGDKPVSTSKGAKSDAIARVKRLYTAANNEPSRKKKHARK